LTLFGGHGEAGKSYVFLTIAAHLACGRDWGPLAMVSARVFFISMEDEPAIVRFRLACICRVYGLDPAMVQRNLTLFNATECEPLMFERSDGGVRYVSPSVDGTALVELVKSERPDLLVIDNASDAFDGDENSRRQVRTFVKWATRAVRGHNGAVVLLAHIDKNAARLGAKGNTYSGSTAWHNSARSRLALVDGEVHHEKSNFGPKLSTPIRIRWDEGVPVPDSSPPGEVAGQGIIHQAEDTTLLRCIQIAHDNGDSIPTATQGPSTAWHALEGYPEFTSAFGTGDGKRRLKSALVRLARAGRIRREMQETAARKFRERWVIAHQEPNEARTPDPTANGRFPWER